jgi:hypothetical protein
MVSFERVRLSINAPSNVKVGLDYIMKNADNEVFHSMTYRQLCFDLFNRFSALSQVAVHHLTATDAGLFPPLPNL